MPVYAVPGESVTVSNPLSAHTFGDTSLVFQVHGVTAVPEASTLAMMLGGLELLVCERCADAAPEPPRIFRGLLRMSLEPK